MTVKPRKRYTDEFKNQAVELASTGRPVSEVAAELEIGADLKHHRGYLAAFRKKQKRLTSKQSTKLQELFKMHPFLKPLYEKLHQIRALMNRKNRTQKQSHPLIKSLIHHIHDLKYSAFKPLETLAATLWDWMEPIACMWRFTKNNGIIEEFHRKMKLIQRRTYGFKNFENYRLRVIAQCG